jgi:deoxyadenosine/deoxycytidine kinase
MLEKAHYIVVEGPIGIGKTPFARRLAEHLQVDTLLDPSAENPFLARFYEDMERYALPAQLFFLFQRMDALRRLAEGTPPGKRVVSDFLLEKDALFAALTLGEHEHALYQRVCDRLKPEARAPDLVIYLQAGPEVLLERLRSRNVEAERRIGEAYLAQVAARYASFFHQYDAAPLFIVNAESLDPVEDDADFRLLLDRLYAMRSYREFFGYA